MKKIFISVSSLEKDLGVLFKNALIRLFGQDVECSLFDIPPGYLWKEKIKNNLKESDILVSILTPHYLLRPWAYVEWTAFWLDDNKKTYIISPERSIESNLYYSAIFNYTQSAFFNEIQTMRVLFDEIGKDLGYNEHEISLKVDQQVIGNLQFEIKQRYEEILMMVKSNEFDRYKNDLSELPFSDVEKREIALHFYEQKDYDSFARVVERILSEEDKFEIAKVVLSKEDLKMFQEVVSMIYTSDRLLSLLVYIVFQKQFVDHNYRNIVLKQMSSMGDESLTEFLIYMIRNECNNNELFFNVLSLLTLEAHKRVVYLNLIEKGRDEEAKIVFEQIKGNPEKTVIAAAYARISNFEMFSEVVDKVTNSVELFRLIKKLELKEKRIEDKYVEKVVNSMDEPSALNMVLNYFKENGLCKLYPNSYEIIEARLKKFGNGQ